MTAEDMLSSDAGIQRILANLYTYIPMGAFSTQDMNTMFANGSRSTPSYYVGGISATWTGSDSFKNLRSINKFIDDLDSALENGVINENDAKSYKGEALAIRAYWYFANVCRYGGVPIIEEVLDDKYDGGENLGLYFPRKTEKESWDWVLAEFQKAADLLPEKLSGRTHGINKYVALGLKARAALWAASESKYWTRAELNKSYNAVSKGLTYMDAKWADDYYKQAIDAAKAVIDSKQYSLAGGTEPADIATATKALENLFQSFDFNEGMLGRSYNTGSATASNGTHNWTANQYISSDYLIGNYSATLNIADEYDYYVSKDDRTSKNGKIITRTAGGEDYALKSPEDKDAPDYISTVADVADYKRYDRISEPFELKDARFQAWFIYPGTTFRGVVANIQGGMITNKNGAQVYPEGNPEYKLGETTYYAYGALAPNTSAFWDLIRDINGNNRSFYSFMIKKFMDLDAYTKTPQSPWYDLRYAEILLTYAEAVFENGAGYGDRDFAKQCLNDIRHRAGFTDNVDLSIENILHEWKVEFAFENKWSSVLYRRRAYFSTMKTPTIEEGDVNDKYTLIPMVDLTGTTPKYIFLRAIPYSSSYKYQNYAGTLEVKNNDSYYSQVPNYVNNRIDQNNK